MCCCTIGKYSIIPRQQGSIPWASTQSGALGNPLRRIYGNTIIWRCQAVVLQNEDIARLESFVLYCTTSPDGVQSDHLGKITEILADKAHK